MAKKRNYQREYAIETQKRRTFRVERNKARRVLMREGLVHVGDNKAVDHKTPLSMGGSNTRRNLRVRSGGANSSYRRNSKGGMKYRSQK